MIKPSRFEDEDDLTTWVYDQIEDYIHEWNNDNINGEVCRKDMLKLIESKRKAEEILRRAEKILSFGKDGFPKHRNEAVAVLADYMKFYNVPDDVAKSVIDMTAFMSDRELYTLLKDIKTEMKLKREVLKEKLDELYMRA